MTILPSHLSRLDDLTRRYARYSRNEAGLGSVWAGACLGAVGALVLVLDLLRYAHRAPSQQAFGFWRFMLAVPAPDPTPATLAGAVALPLVWLLGRYWIQRRIYERAGTVIAREQGQEVTSRQIFMVIELVLAVLVVGSQLLHFVIRGFPEDIALRGTVILAGAAALPLIGRTLTSGLDRAAWMLLLLGGFTLISGGYSESRLVSMLAYSAIGVVQAVYGLRAHWRFLDVSQELARLAAVSNASGCSESPATTNSAAR